MSQYIGINIYERFLTGFSLMGVSFLFLLATLNNVLAQNKYCNQSCSIINICVKSSVVGVNDRLTFELS